MNLVYLVIRFPIMKQQNEWTITEMPSKLAEFEKYGISYGEEMGGDGRTVFPSRCNTAGFSYEWSFSVL